VLHFDGKAIVEEYIKSIGVPSTSVQLAIYMEFALLSLQPIASGSKSYKFSVPVPSMTKFPLIAVNEDTGKYVKSILLNREKMLGRRVLVAENLYTLDDCANILKETAGLDVAVEQCSDEDYRKGLAAVGYPEFMQDDLSDIMSFIKEYGFYGGVGFEADHEVI